MTSAVIHRELWTSFASMIRSYGAAQGLNSRHQAIVEVGNDQILLRVGTRWLRITPDAMTEDNNRSQPFQLHEDGTVTVGSGSTAITEDMDFTAERLTRELMQ
jgi:bisphosphoglycerate-dependent phosphoglycerate mutase